MRHWNTMRALLLISLLAGMLIFNAATPAGAQNHAAANQAKPAAIPAGQNAVQEQQEEAPQVEISPEQQKLIGVKTVKAAIRPLQKVIRASGRIEADESRLATINAKIEGWIETLYVNTTGAYIKKGAKLAELYSPELVATQEEYLAALKWAEETAARKNTGDGQKTSSPVTDMLARDAQASLEAAKRRLLLWDISLAQIEQIAKTKKSIRTLTLYAPASGYVTQKMAVAGMRVMPGEKLFDIADFTNLWVIADIYEYELPMVRIGGRATITVPSWPGTQYPSYVDYIYPDLAPQTRTAKIRLKLTNPQGRLKPQMFTNVVLQADLGRKLAVPESAVLDTGRAMVVYVDRGEGIFEPREVKTGLRADGYVEVLRGLKAGEAVVASANFLVDSEAQLKGIKPLPSR